MHIYDCGIVDNFNDLKSINDILSNDDYKNMINIWERLDQYPKDITELKNLFKKYESNEPSNGWVSDLPKALSELSKYTKSLLDDDLFGIYYGLIPVQDCTGYLPSYFIFRCSNNGRSLIISERKIDKE